MFTSVGYPANTVENLELNTLGDGLFHASAYAFILIGLVMVWSGSRLATLRWSTKLLLGGLLAGWGTFNLAEGFVGHHILGIHHVRSGPGQAWWDLGFLAWGAVMLVGGLLLTRAGDRQTGREVVTEATRQGMSAARPLRTRREEPSRR